MKKIFGTLILSTVFLLGGAENFVGGKVGMAFQGRHEFNSSVFSPGQGTFQCWVKPDRPLSELQSAMLLTVGVNAPGWIYCVFDKGSIRVSFKTAKGFDGGKLENVEMKPGTWHHFAFVWGKYKDKTFLNLYVDGVLKLHREKLEFPDKLSGGKFGLGYNISHYAAPDFPGAIDEVAIHSIPLDAKTIQTAYQRGMDGKKLEPDAGCTFYAPLDGSFDFAKGKEADARLTTQMLRRSSRNAKTAKYTDELEFSYRISQLVTEKKEGSLNDGDEATYIVWKNTPREIICELPHTCDLRRIEVTAPKFTKWYMLKELHISVDNGSGEFGEPEILKTYYRKTTNQTPLTDNTCKRYYYSLENPGRASRVKIKAVGDAVMALSEIRICGKTAQ